MFELAWPWIWIIAPAPLIVWALTQRKQKQQALKLPLFLRWQNFNQQESSSNFNFPWLLMLIWLLLVLAASRPQWLGDTVRLPSSGRDLMLSIDISGSMEMEDMVIENRYVNRLIAVKHIVSDFIERRQGDRLGLILFGEQAYLQAPLTQDLKTIKHMLDESEIGLAGPSATAIGDSIGLAVKRLKDRNEKNRVLILLTDGQNNAGVLQPLQAAQLAEHAGITIYTIGIGADEIVSNNGMFRRRFNPSRELDEVTLKKVAELTNGRYFRARDLNELENIYKLLDKLEPVSDDDQSYRPTKSLFFIPITLILLLSFIQKIIQLIRNKNHQKQKDKGEKYA